MVDKLLEGDNSKPEPAPEQQLADVITSHNPGETLFTPFYLQGLQFGIEKVKLSTGFPFQLGSGLYLVVILFMCKSWEET